MKLAVCQNDKESMRVGRTSGHFDGFFLEMSSYDGRKPVNIRRAIQLERKGLIKAIILDVTMLVTCHKHHNDFQLQRCNCTSQWCTRSGFRSPIRSDIGNFFGFGLV